MNRVLIILVIVTISLSTYAKKRVYPFEIVTALADLIVIGEIEKVGLNTYKFKVDETLKGISDSTITVEKFEEWLCDTRYARHEVGENLCLFLKKKGGKWQIINGSTGEVPIYKGNVHLRYERFKKENGEYVQAFVLLNEFSSGIRAFLNCYEFNGKRSDWDYKSTFKRKCDSNELSSLKKSSPFAAWLVAKAVAREEEE